MNSIDLSGLNPLLRDVHARQVSELIDAFPALRSVENPRVLSLWKYLHACPQRFFSVDAYDTYLDCLVRLYASRKEELLRLLHDQRAHLDNAYRHADEICSQGWHDGEIHVRDDYGRLIFIDQELHPAYLRLTEAVFRPLLHILAYFSRLHRGKRTESLDLHQIVQELSSADFDHILDPYRPLDAKRYRPWRYHLRLQPNPVRRQEGKSKTSRRPRDHTEIRRSSRRLQRPSSSLLRIHAHQQRKSRYFAVKPHYRRA